MPLKIRPLRSTLAELRRSWEKAGAARLLSHVCLQACILRLPVPSSFAESRRNWQMDRTCVLIAAMCSWSCRTLSPRSTRYTMCTTTWHALYIYTSMYVTKPRRQNRSCPCSIASTSALPSSLSRSFLINSAEVSASACLLPGRWRYNLKYSWPMSLFPCWMYRSAWISSTCCCV